LFILHVVNQFHPSRARDAAVFADRKASSPSPIPQPLRGAHWRGYHQAIAAGHTRLGDKPMLTRATHKDGSKLYVELAFGIVSDASGAILGALATGRRAAKP